MILECWTTARGGGKLVFHFFGALAEFERDLIKERTLAGLAAARARGRVGGPPKPDAGKVAMAQKLYKDKSNSIDTICKTLRISRPTIYRYLKVGQERLENGT